MKSVAEIETVVRDAVASHPEVLAVYLFGSVARGSTRAGSDIDLGVLSCAAPPPTLDGLLLGVEGDIERELGAPVQVVVLNTAPPDLVHRVLRDGRLLIDRDPSFRIRFEVRARNEFFDVQPTLDRDRTGRPDIQRDIKEERFVEHTLQIAIQAALDAASHVVSDRRLGEPRTNRDLLDDLLAFVGAIRPLATRPEPPAGTRT